MDENLWAAFGIASLPALAAVGAAWIASRAASKARGSQAEADRLQLLEQRLAVRKQEVYEPMIELLGNLMGGTGASPSDLETQRRLSEFSRWIVVVGSDGAVEAFRNFMQAAFNDAPPYILIRLQAEFQLAARRDMGDPSTSLSTVEILGLRINDLHSEGDEKKLLATLEAPFEQACARLGWEIPWKRRAVA